MTDNDRALRNAPSALRPPAVPLIACDPYFSVWSRADSLTDTFTSHWTGKRQSLTSLIRVDGTTWRLMGDEPSEVAALPQTSTRVLPTRTICVFEGAEVQVTLTFMTPVLPGDLDVLSRPVTYLTWDVQSADGEPHDVAVYLGASAELVVNEPSQPVVWSCLSDDALTVLRTGSDEQPVLEKQGDDLRIDWGHAYLAAPLDSSSGAIASNETCVRTFLESGTVPPQDDARQPRTVDDEMPVMAFALPLGQVQETVSSYAILAYDDEYSIEYMQSRLRPYWRRNGLDALGLLRASASEYPSLQEQCAAFDAELMTDLERQGGERYARLCALVYRQAHAANKVVADADGQPLMFPKENFSNGCIGTVDVIYPMLPQFLLLNPALAKAALVPVLNYAASERWKWPFAPHDLGRYPHANGQVYGGGEETEENQMPVEESGNMLLLIAAIARIEGNADFADAFWTELTGWAAYLADKGFDPENQLCTDDFAGHLAHNVNLSAKAILALRAYAMLCEMRGDTATAVDYRSLAEGMVSQWIEAADDGDHFRLTFDRAGTWSQKYNLAWDRILEFGLFPPEIAQKEMAYYRAIQDTYGLPLDSRNPYTKIDWILWTATLTGDREDFDDLVSRVEAFVNATPDRNPLTDWYMTDTARQRGMIARPVVGGFFMQMLTAPCVWEKWARRDTTAYGPWAPIPEAQEDGA